MMVLTKCPNPECNLEKYWNNPYRYTVRCPKCEILWTFDNSGEQIIIYDICNLTKPITAY